MFILVSLGILTVWWLWRLVGSLIHRVSSISPATWSTIGEILRNTSGLLALLGAVAAVTVAWRTNKTRAREAAGTEFRQHLQWCVEKLGQDDADYIEKLFALDILGLYGSKKDRRLSKREREIAARFDNLAHTLHAPKDAEDIQDETRDSQD